MSKSSKSQIVDWQGSFSGMNSYYRDFCGDTVPQMTRFFLSVMTALLVLSCNSNAMADSDEPPLLVTAAGGSGGGALGLWMLFGLLGLAGLNRKGVS
jgi:hypothetical protein